MSRRMAFELFLLPLNGRLFEPPSDMVAGSNGPNSVALESRSEDYVCYNALLS